MTIRNTSFIARSVQMIFSILLQHHTSELPMYFWTTFRNVQSVSTVHSYALNEVFYWVLTLHFKTNFLLKRVLILWINFWVLQNAGKFLTRWGHVGLSGRIQLHGVSQPACHWVSYKVPLLLLAACRLCHGNPSMYLTCTSFICYQATRTGDMFNILLLSAMYHNLYYGWVTLLSSLP
jgi:hypothetical protein